MLIGLAVMLPNGIDPGSKTFFLDLPNERLTGLVD
jgi:hypothetical protein